MENDLEKYIDDNRDEFEKDVPSPGVWQNLETHLKHHHKKKKNVFGLIPAKLVAAASIIIVACAGVIGYFAYNQHGGARLSNKNTKPAQANAVAKNTGQNSNDALLQKKRVDQMAQAKAQATTSKPGETNSVAFDPEDISQVLFHYTTAVKARQNEIKAIQKINPGLFNYLQKAIADLDAEYAQLQSELPGSIDKEKVLQSMIDNLQMQETILSHQLQVIKKLPSNKSEKDEGPYHKI